MDVNNSDRLTDSFTGLDCSNSQDSNVTRDLTKSDGSWTYLGGKSEGARDGESCNSNN